MSNLIELSYPELQSKASSLGLKSVGIKKTDLISSIQSVMDKETTELDQPTETDQNNDPVATGKLGGNGEFYFFPDTLNYAPMVNGKADQPSFNQVTWDLVSPALPSVNVAKSTVIKAMEKKAEIKLNKYRVTLSVNFEPEWFEDTDELSGTYNLEDALALFDRMEKQTVALKVRKSLIEASVTISAKGSKSSGNGKGHIGGTTDRFDRPDISQPVPSYKIKPVTFGSSAHTCLMALTVGRAKDQDYVNEISIINGTEPYDVKKQNWKIRQVIAQTGYGLSSDGYLVFPDGLDTIKTK